MNTTNFSTPRPLVFALTCYFFAPLASADTGIDEVIVSGDLRDSTVLESAASISLFDNKLILKRQARHLEDLLNSAPNVNFSSGASRGRFIQIRGIGERSQFIEPLNPSVGIMVDGIDFTGIAGAATTMDIQQVEILRGPQGTLYGANALAGLISLRAVQPSEQLQGNLEVALADYNSRTLSAGVGGPLSNNLGFRLAVQKHSSDGYVENDFLSRSDTNNIDELSLRSILDWQATEDTNLKLTIFHVEADNGYDAFSLDNSRNTLSDNPGQDRHEATAVALQGSWQGHASFELASTLSYANNNLEYGYDEDWTYSDICVDFVCIYDGYESVDNYIRDSHNGSLDVRLTSKDGGQILNGSTDWVLGAYWREQDEALLRQYSFAAGDFVSDFKTSNRAIYAQLDSHLSSNLTLVTGLRLENREADYSDSEMIDHGVDEDLWGARVALQYRTASGPMVYGLVSRGYKAGGVNSDPALDAVDREFDTEQMWNIEGGVKGLWLDGSLQAQLAVFYQLRDDIQIKQSLVQPIDETNATSFTDYFGNAAKGTNMGTELEFNWFASETVALFGSIGLLKTEFDTPLSETLDGREQAHAPSYQFALGASFQVTDSLAVGLDIEGKDEFFLSSRHSAKTQSYELLNANLTYDTGDWQLSLWGRNLTDEDVIVRGFGSFGNDPRKGYETEPYYQYGAPRVFGLTGKYDF
ncbi:MAG: TonB-dependent receptor [Porticoccaceae bacterium]|nr:TonB-dependent receptor [Porticoccaceae bacterium]